MSYIKTVLRMEGGGGSGVPSGCRATVQPLPPVLHMFNASEFFWYIFLFVVCFKVENLVGG